MFNKNIYENLAIDKNHLFCNQLITKIDFGFQEFSGSIILDSCVIDEIYLRRAWFKGGFAMKNCIVKKFINYVEGVHNQRPFILDGNIFEDFFCFFDCHFEDEVYVCNNIFRKGSDLLGNKEKGFHTLFSQEPIINNNLGRLDFDEDEVEFPHSINF